MRIPRTTIRRFLLAVALIAADLASIRGSIDVNLLVAVPVLQVCLFRVVSSCGSIRPFWVGFEAFGWAWVMFLLSGVGPLWFRFVDGRLNDAIGSIAERHPGAGRAVAMVVLCEGTPILDTVPGLLPESLIAGVPVLLLALIGGLLSVSLASRRGRTGRTQGAPSELSVMRTPAHQVE